MTVRSRRSRRKAALDVTGIAAAQRSLVELKADFERWKRRARHYVVNEIREEIEAGKGGETRASIVDFLERKAKSLMEPVA